MKKKYKVGDIVFAKSNPSLKLVVCETINGYYCKAQEVPVRAPQILFEKELLTPQKPELPTVVFTGGTLMNIWKKKADKVVI